MRERPRLDGFDDDLLLAEVWAQRDALLMALKHARRRCCSPTMLPCVGCQDDGDLITRIESES